VTLLTDYIMSKLDSVEDLETSARLLAYESITQPDKTLTAREARAAVVAQQHVEEVLKSIPADDDALPSLVSQLAQNQRQFAEAFALTAIDLDIAPEIRATARANALEAIMKERAFVAAARWVVTGLSQQRGGCIAIVQRTRPSAVR